MSDEEISAGDDSSLRRRRYPKVEETFHTGPLVGNSQPVLPGATSAPAWSYWRDHKIPEWLDSYYRRFAPTEEAAFLNHDAATDGSPPRFTGVMGEVDSLFDYLGGCLSIGGSSECSLSTHPSERDEEDSFSTSGSSRKSSNESSREEDTYSTRRPLTEEQPLSSGDLPPYDRQDSLLEAVLAAKRRGWTGLQRTDSLDSGTSMSSFASSSCCNCDDCFLGLSDKPLGQTQPQNQTTNNKKNSHWRKVRNVVQWSPFIQTYKRHKYPWVQLAGHQGNFKAGHRQGTIMKKLCPAEEKAFCAIAKDTLQAFVPEYLGVVEGSDGENYLQLQDLLSNFSSACVMDIKMGVRTYLEEELAKARIKPKLRKDMYDKMVQIDGAAPTEAEHRAKAVTKPRYMVWRETISSTATLGFRIEGVRRGDGSSSKDFKTTRTREQVLKAIAGFVDGYPQSVIKYIQRLKVIKLALEKSKFFKSHELIGSSLLFVHNEEKSGIWLIDFAKTIPLPDSVKVSHNVPWIEGTHEDGYLIGLENLIELLECIQENPSLLPSNNPIKKDTLTDIPDAELQPSQGNLSEDKLSPPVTLLEAPADENDGGKKITNYSVENRHSRLEVSALPDMLHFPKKNPRGSLSSSAKEAICEVAITTKNVG